MSGFNTQPELSSDVQIPRLGQASRPSTAARSSRAVATTQEIVAMDCDLKVTLDRWRSGYTSQQLGDARFHATRISAEEAVVLKLLATSLNEQGKKLSDGRNVQTNQHALRWMLQQLVDQVPEDVMQRLCAQS